MMSAMSDEVKAVADFSKSVDYALSILGKFRLRDNIDTFGFGRKLTLAPAHIFIFADKQSQKEPFKLNRDEGYLHDFISHPYRWDHHVHLFVIEDSRSSNPKQNGDENNEDVLESGIAELVHSTGGSIFTVSSMREARSVMTTLLQNVIGATPTVTMRLGISSDDETSSSMMATMKVPQSERATNENQHGDAGRGLWLLQNCKSASSNQQWHGTKQAVSCFRYQISTDQGQTLVRVSFGVGFTSVWNLCLPESRFVFDCSGICMGAIWFRYGIGLGSHWWADLEWTWTPS